MENILEIKNIEKQYAAHKALNNVSFNVPSKSIFGLLGPNGAGKTSLIRIINQITEPDRGEVLLNGQKLAPHHISQIGYLPEERGLYKKMKVGEQTLYLAQLKGMDKKEALKKLKMWFEKFEILSWWDKTIEELSKGMQQKIQFITTVLHEPKLLILDEPFSGFDPINTELIKKEILELRKNGASIIFSTHNMKSVEEICDHIALINKSEKILEGKVKEVKQQFKTNTYEIQFRGNMIAFTNAMWSGVELLSNTETEGVIIAKIKLLDNFTLNSLLSAVLPHIELISVNEIIPSMNDIFIQKITEINNGIHQNIAS